MVQMMGHETQLARNGDAALALAFADPPELVLLDIGLPGIDGYEVVRRLRAHPRTAALRVIALTGYTQPQDRRRAEAAGFDGFLTKPVEVAVLEEVLAAADRPGALAS
jgi:CheY-like chemotaxis protein